MRAYATHVLSGLAIVAGALCATPSLADPARAAAAPAYTESGEASWYGPRHEGQRTTSGERFDSRKLTAAHPSLPMGTWVRVTVQDSGRSIVVRVNDREPPHGVRCIDLSHEAAQRLGIVRRGLADVTLAQISPAEALTEVAEAPDDAQTVEPTSRHHRASARHGRRHTRPARR